MTTIPHLASRRAYVLAVFPAMQDSLLEHGWTDGLPVVPPFDNVKRMAHYYAPRSSPC